MRSCCLSHHSICICMRSYLVGKEAWNLVVILHLCPYFALTSSGGSGEPVCKTRVSRTVLTAHKCDKWQNVMKWLNCSLSSLNCDFPAQLGNTFSTLSNVQRNTRTQQDLTNFPKCDVKGCLDGMI